MDQRHVCTDIQAHQLVISAAQYPDAPVLTDIQAAELVARAIQKLNGRESLYPHHATDIQPRHIDDPIKSLCFAYLDFIIAIGVDRGIVNQGRFEVGIRNIDDRSNAESTKTNRRVNKRGPVVHGPGRVIHLNAGEAGVVEGIKIGDIEVVGILYIQVFQPVASAFQNCQHRIGTYIHQDQLVVMAYQVLQKGITPNIQVIQPVLVAFQLL